MEGEYSWNEMRFTLLRQQVERLERKVKAMEETVKVAASNPERFYPLYPKESSIYG